MIFYDELMLCSDNVSEANPKKNRGEKLLMPPTMKPRLGLTGMWLLVKTASMQYLSKDICSQENPLLVRSDSITIHEQNNA